MKRDYWNICANAFAILASLFIFQINPSLGISFGNIISVIQIMALGVVSYLFNKRFPIAIIAGYSLMGIAILFQIYANLTLQIEIPTGNVLVERILLFGYVVGYLIPLLFVHYIWLAQKQGSTNPVAAVVPIPTVQDPSSTVDQSTPVSNKPRKLFWVMIKTVIITPILYLLISTFIINPFVFSFLRASGYSSLVLMLTVQIGLLVVIALGVFFLLKQKQGDNVGSVVAPVTSSRVQLPILFNVYVALLVIITLSAPTATGEDMAGLIWIFSIPLMAIGLIVNSLLKGAYFRTGNKSYRTFIFINLAVWTAFLTLMYAQFIPYIFSPKSKQPTVQPESKKELSSYTSEAVDSTISNESQILYAKNMMHQSLFVPGSDNRHMVDLVPQADLSLVSKTEIILIQQEISDGYIKTGRDCVNRGAPLFNSKDYQKIDHAYAIANACFYYLMER